MNRKLSIALTVLLAFGMAAQTFAAGTPAGTVITNRAYGGFSDANGNVIADVDNPATRIQSDEVTTTVSQVYGVDIESTQAKDLPRNQSVTYTMTVENTGNGDDTFDLSQITVGSGYTVTVYEDPDADGVHDAGEVEVTETSELAADGVYHFVVVVADANGTQGETYATTVTATSQGSGAETDNSVLTSTVQAALMTASLSPDAIVKDPGDVITYTVSYGNSNDTNSETAYGVSVALPVPANCAWVGNVTLNGTPTGTGAGVAVSVGSVAAGGSGTITYQVLVNSPLPQGTTIDNQISVDYNDSATQPYTQVVAYANAGTGGRVTVNEVNGFTTDIAPASQSGDPGDVVRYLVTVNNTGNGSDSFELSNFSSSQSWSWTFYIDTNDNGVFNAGVDLAATNTGAIASGRLAGHVGRSDHSRRHGGRHGGRLRVPRHFGRQLGHQRRNRHDDGHRAGSEPRQGSIPDGRPAPGNNPDLFGSDQQQRIGRRDQRHHQGRDPRQHHLRRRKHADRRRDPDRRLRLSDRRELLQRDHGRFRRGFRVERRFGDGSVPGDDRLTVPSGTAHGRNEATEQ
jgi:hypothetical protein